MKKKNVILAPAFFYNFEQLKPFVKSHLASQVNGKILFLVEGEKRDLLEAKEEYKNFEILVVDDIISRQKNKLEKISMYPYIYLWWKTNYANIIEARNISDLVRPWMREALLIHVRRYLISLEYLELNHSKIDKVILTDTRDVIFQDDPFKKISKGLYCGLESIKVFNEYHNRQWVEKLYSGDVRRNLYNKVVSCSGVTLGDCDSVILYLKAMVKEILRQLPKICFKHFDQAIHNYIIYSQDERFDVNFCVNGGSLVATLGASVLQEFKIEQEKIYTRDGDLISIIHQYHPHTELREWFVKIYS